MKKKKKVKNKNKKVKLFYNKFNFYFKFNFKLFHNNINKNYFLLKNKNKLIYKMKKELKYSFSKNRNENKNSKISTSDLNLILSTVYDDEFVSLINKLSSSIKIFSKSNNKNFNKMKNLFQIEYNPSNEVLFTFSNIEKDFSNFYLTAKAIFKKMKIYRNDKLSSLSNLKFKNINNR